MYQPIHLKYRPQTFSQLVGQDGVSVTLSNAIAQDRVVPAYLFTGSRGTGKTSSARILAKSLNCQANVSPTPVPCGSCNSCRAISLSTSLDVTEMDAASNSGVDNIREIVERCQFNRVESRYKIYIIDEVHALSSQAFQALLKTLEEPPSQVVFILCTTEAHKIPATIASRCQRFDFKRVGLEEIVRHLKYIALEEKIDIPDESIRLVAQLSNGGLRDAQTLLDKLNLLDTEISPNAIAELVGSVSEQDLLGLLEAISSSNLQQTISILRQLQECGKDASTILQNIAACLQNLLIAKTSPSSYELVALTAGSFSKLSQIALGWHLPSILSAQQHLRECEPQVRLSSQPQLWLEIAVLGLLPHSSIDAPITSKEETLPIWTKWTRPTEAICWAHEQLPHISKERLQQHMDAIKPINGKKAIAWVDFVERQKQAVLHD